MRRRIFWTASGFVSLAALLVAQAPEPPSSARAKAEGAYRAWREADPNLEADAANSPTTLGVRSDRVSAEAAQYFAAQQTYLAAVREELEREAAQFTEAAAIPEVPPAGRSGALAAASQSVNNNLAATADSSDAGLRDLRRALERERAALAAVAPAVQESAARSGAIEEGAKALADARAQFLNDSGALKTVTAEEEEASRKIGTDWANYYRLLAAAVREAATAPVKTASAAPVAVAPIAPVPEVAPVPEPGHAPEPQPSDGIAPAAIRSTAPGIPPASRYAGDWIYPTVNEHYHGARPEYADLIVREERGQMRGSFLVKFRLASTSTIDPVVEFTFSGPYQNAKSQSFAVTLTDGTKGTFEMIPATTINLLEINFVMDERSGKISRGNFFVLRK